MHVWMSAHEVQELAEREGWTADELAAFYYVDRSTAYRWLASGCTTKGKSAALLERLKKARKRDARNEQPRRSEAR